ncbi:MAG: hypothetical protein WDO13_16300 [Verrucomicrobiota bacterium]
MLDAASEARRGAGGEHGGPAQGCARDYIRAAIFSRRPHHRHIPIVINSDAHAPAEVAYEFDRAYKLVSDVGYTKSCASRSAAPSRCRSPERPCPRRASVHPPDHLRHGPGGRRVPRALAAHTRACRTTSRA